MFGISYPLDVTNFGLDCLRRADKLPLDVLFIGLGERLAVSAFFEDSFIFLSLVVLSVIGSIVCSF